MKRTFLSLAFLACLAGCGAQLWRARTATRRTTSDATATARSGATWKRSAPVRTASTCCNRPVTARCWFAAI